MKRLAAILLATLIAAGCSGSGSVDEDDGQVVARRINNGTTYQLKLSDVVPHGTRFWWQTVSITVFYNCPIGAQWSKHNPDGCG